MKGAHLQVRQYGGEERAAGLGYPLAMVLCMGRVLGGDARYRSGWRYAQMAGLRCMNGTRAAGCSAKGGRRWQGEDGWRCELELWCWSSSMTLRSSWSEARASLGRGWSATLTIGWHRAVNTCLRHEAIYILTNAWEDRVSVSFCHHYIIVGFLLSLRYSRPPTIFAATRRSPSLSSPFYRMRPLPHFCFHDDHHRSMRVCFLSDLSFGYPD